MAQAQAKATGERAVFRQFAKASGLPIRMNSIRSRVAPEPDIRCTVSGEGSVAFELGEVVGRPFAEATNQRPALRRLFRDEYSSMSEAVRSQLQARLGGPPAVFIAFAHGTSPGRWKYAITPILAMLGERADQMVEGEIRVWDIPRLKDVLLEMVVRRASSRSASLHVMELTEVFDETVNLLAKKFAKRYTCRAPVELVAYYISQPPFDRPGWLEPIETYVSANIGASPFRRVWLYDNFERTIRFVTPVTQGEARSARG